MASLRSPTCLARKTFYESKVAVLWIFSPEDFPLASPLARFPPSGMHLIWPPNCMYWHLFLASFFEVKKKAEVNVNFSMKHSWRHEGEDSLLFLLWISRKSYRAADRQRSEAQNLHWNPPWQIIQLQLLRGRVRSLLFPHLLKQRESPRQWVYSGPRLVTLFQEPNNANPAALCSLGFSHSFCINLL